MPFFCCHTIGIIADAAGMRTRQVPPSKTLASVQELSQYTHEIPILDNPDALLDTLLRNPKGVLLKIDIRNHSSHQQPPRFVFHLEDKHTFLEVRMEDHHINRLFAETDCYVKACCAANRHSDLFKCIRMERTLTAIPPWYPSPLPPYVLSSTDGASTSSHTRREEHNWGV